MERLRIERIECVQLDGFDPTAPADPLWRVEIAGRCYDFDTEVEAKNLIAAIAEYASAPLPSSDRERVRDEAWNAAIEAAEETTIELMPDGVTKVFVRSGRDIRDAIRALRTRGESHG